MKIKIAILVLPCGLCSYYQFENQKGTCPLCKDFVGALLGHTPDRIKVEVSTNPLKGGFSATWNQDAGKLIPSKRIHNEISEGLFVISYRLMSDAQEALKDILKPDARLYIRITDVSE